MKKVLVTGGCGYIGYNMVLSLLGSRYDVIVVDSLINSSRAAINENTIFYEGDIRDKEMIKNIFQENKIDLVMDFAALLDVEESWEIPEEYLDVNVNGLINLLEIMNEFDVRNIIFSSTAAVYGNSMEMVDENSELNPTNPYGFSKYTAEKFLEYYCKKYEIKHIIFRYFNVVGSKKVDYDWDKFSSVVPNILTALQSGREFIINGNDYDTSDGTCVRDYIHMNDLIDAHQLVINNLSYVQSGAYNLSIGKGTSVLELYKQIKEQFEIVHECKFGARREGDIIYSVASNEKILEVIPWKIKYDNIQKIVKKIYKENTDWKVLK